MGLWYLSVFAFVAVGASAQTNLSFRVNQVTKDGCAIPDLLEHQWTVRIAQLRQDLNSNASAFLLDQKLTDKEKASVRCAFTELQKVIGKIALKLTAFKKLQNIDAIKISKDYKSFLASRLAAEGADATNEAAIHKLREVSQETVNSWVTMVSRIHEYAHQDFEKEVRSLAASTSSKIADRQEADKVRVTITEFGIRLLNVLVNNLNENTGLLTGRQLNLYQSFFDEATELLLQLLDKAKNKSG